MNALFYESKHKDFSDIENWNVSSIKNMAGIFKEAVSFNQDISK